MMIKSVKMLIVIIEEYFIEYINTKQFPIINLYMICILYHFLFILHLHFVYYYGIIISLLFYVFIGII